ncbi:unnamed protein product [Porites evermanni]|uniref:Uncharacterized protein n=1 Tax=Porites evermanni TaxID=104178 RepID=A0ABN8RJS3_9CNID|nr:unnamed protein product [Porites evermanni]
MSTLQQVALLMFLIFLPMVISRECYECRSSFSFQACDASRRRVRCLSSQHCITASAKRTSGIKDEGYVKGCAATCSASDIPICNNPNYKCEVKCCSSDYCNGGGAGGRAPGGASGGVSSPMVNRILLIATFTASVMYLFSC